MMKSLVQKVAEDEGFSCRSYSGRGMFGASCLGIDVEQLDSVFKLGVLVGAEDADFDFGDVRWDSMGRDYIIYFPDLKYSEEDAEENED